MNLMFFEIDGVRLLKADRFVLEYSNGFFGDKQACMIRVAYKKPNKVWGKIDFDREEHDVKVYFQSSVWSFTAAIDAYRAYGNLHHMNMTPTSAFETSRREIH